MANQVEIKITADPKDAQAGFKKTQSAFGKMADGIKKHRKAIGIGLTAIGAGITAIGISALKSSLDQQVGISRLDQSLKNVGESYDGQREAIERVIEAQQRKTNFGDEAQREALQKLITIGGKWEGSLEALMVAADLAAGAGMDLNAASLLLGSVRERSHPDRDHGGLDQAIRGRRRGISRSHYSDEKPPRGFAPSVRGFLAANRRSGGCKV